MSEHVAGTRAANYDIIVILRMNKAEALDRAADIGAGRCYAQVARVGSRRTATPRGCHRATTDFGTAIYKGREIGA